MIQNIRPTSKVSLKMSCLHTCNGDIDKAEKLYNFLSSDLEDLPTFDAVQPTTMQQVRESAVQTFKWVNENQDTIMNWIGVIRNLFGKGGKGSSVSAPTTPMPSINP